MYPETPEAFAFALFEEILLRDPPLQASAAYLLALAARCLRVAKDWPETGQIEAPSTQLIQ